MNNLDYLNLSADLRRISLWMVEEQDKMVEIFLPKLIVKFKNDKTIEGKKPISQWLKEVAKYKVERQRAAERALTLSAILLR